MIKLLSSTLVLGGLLIFSAPLYAETYQYVDTNGNLQVVVANSPAEAIKNAPNIAFDSGVMTATGSVGGSGDVTGTAGLHTYGYVDTQGFLRTQVARSPAEAIALAPNRDPHSGVMLISN